MSADNTEARAAVIARLAREHGAAWDYILAVSQYSVGLSVQEAELFDGAVDLLDAVQAQIDSEEAS
jgi:hypothetical protein